MFQVSQLVIYGGHGVCRIIEMEQRVIDRKTVQYFVLEPLSQPGTRYLIPSQNPAALSKLRHLLEKDRLLALISDRNLLRDWVPEENRRKQLYRQVVSDCDPVSLIGMLRRLELHRRAQEEIGRKIHMCDDNFMKEAYKLLAGEICVVFDISMSEAMNLLRQQLIVE